MLEAPIPGNEAQRLAALRALNVLDTAPEERFDRLTRMAKRLFGVQTVLVSLVDANRQWFKSAQGLDACETPRDISFCGHAILQDQPLVVSDAMLDVRFADNPLVVGEPFIRFYAGHPLAAPDGQKVGTLCLIDGQPRSLDEDELALLADMARMVEHELAMVQLAMIDELTGLSNRRGFELLLDQTLALCSRLNRSASLLFFDLDRFKDINDQHGHAVGDRVLADFAHLLRQTFRSSDLLGRLGGDEFVVLLSVSDLAERERALERLARSVQGYNADGSRGWELAYSVGFADATPESRISGAALLAEADRRMYLQKQQHRQGQ